MSNRYEMQLMISCACMALTSAVIGNAYYQKHQFYPAVVYITKSNASMAVIYIQFFVIVFMFGKLLRKIFLGTLRTAEFEHLIERFWYALTETCLAFTVFRDDFNPRFVALFTVLLFLKSFHWLAEERVDFMERSPVLGWLFHLRVASLLALLGVFDYILLVHAYNSTLVRGPTVQLVFGFEYAILLTVIGSTAIKYVLHAAEMRTDTPWENKAVFLLYTELVIGLIKLILYFLFVIIMAKIYALPMFVFRPMFFTIRNFRRALYDVIMSRRAIRNMNTLYPDATNEELRSSDNICIICREDMVSHSKKLPCGHIFHTACLRSWFQRQQTCPTCRLNILRTPNINSTALPRQVDNPPVAGVVGGGAAPQNAAGAQAPATAGTVQPPDAGAPTFPLPMGYEIFNDPNFLSAIGGAGTATNNLTMPTLPPSMMAPTFPFFAPYSVPPPPMPPDLNNYTDEELRELEGEERRNIEARIKLLQNIQLMLDSASIMMNHYQMTAPRMHPASTTVVPTDTTSIAATVTAGTTTTSASATTTVTSTKAINSDVYDKPSTSAAAAAINAQNALQVKSAKLPNTDSTINQPARFASSSSTSKSSTSVCNKVTIEDLGADCDDVPTTSQQLTTNKLLTASDTADGINSNENDELSELRKRRLKFLGEDKSTASAD